jgi:hypothetical protein
MLLQMLCTLLSACEWNLAVVAAKKVTLAHGARGPMILEVCLLAIDCPCGLIACRVC